MASISYVLSTVVMGLFTVGIAVAVVRISTQRQSPVTANQRKRNASAGGESTDALSRYASVVGEAARTPGTWYVGFVVLVFGFAAGALAMVTGPPAIGAAVGLGLIVASAAVFCVFLFWGIYHSGRSQGLQSAQAAMAGAWALGSLLIVAIVVKLVTAAP
jgi:hypothetical protein